MTEQEFIDKHCCTDDHAEYCNDDCDSCERKFKKDLEVIKERIRADAIYEYMNKLCDKCIQTPNECCNLECPFADDGCQIVKIAEQLKEQNQ